MGGRREAAQKNGPRGVKYFRRNYPSNRTSARAVFPSWVIVRAIFLTPRPLAISQAAPASLSVGLPLGSRTTSISIQRTPRAQPVPSAFMAASLAAKRPAHRSPRRRCESQYAISDRVETRYRKNRPRRSIAVCMRSICMISPPKPIIIKTPDHQSFTQYHKSYRSSRTVHGRRYDRLRMGGRFRDTDLATRRQNEARYAKVVMADRKQQSNDSRNENPIVKKRLRATRSAFSGFATGLSLENSTRARFANPGIVRARA